MPRHLHRGKTHQALNQEGNEAHVEVGKVRIKGHFAGNVITSSLNMEVAMPIDHEVPIDIVKPVLVSFRDSAEAVGNSEMAGVWQNLMGFFLEEAVATVAVGATHNAASGGSASNRQTQAIAEAVDASPCAPSPGDIPKQAVFRRLLETHSAKLEALLDAEQLTVLLRERSMELLEVRSRYTQQQSEILQLKLNNAMLAGHLASVEASAQKLRNSFKALSQRCGPASRSPRRRPLEADFTCKLGGAGAWDTALRESSLEHEPPELGGRIPRALPPMPTKVSMRRMSDDSWIKAP